MNAEKWFAFLYTKWAENSTLIYQIQFVDNVCKRCKLFYEARQYFVGELEMAHRLWFVNKQELFR